MVEATEAKATVAGPNDGEGEAPAPGGTMGRDVGLSAGAAVLFLLLRVMAVSHWDWSTAFALADVVDFGDAVTIIFGTLFAEQVYASILLMWLFPLTAIRLVWPIHDRGRILPNVLLLAACAVCILALVITFREWWLPVGVLVVAAVVIVVRLVWRSGIGLRGVTFVMRSIGVTALAGVLLLAAVVTAPWVPKEHIRTDMEVITGYVLKAEPGFLKILTQDTRELAIVPAADVKSRSEARDEAEVPNEPSEHAK